MYTLIIKSILPLTSFYILRFDHLMQFFRHCQDARCKAFYHNSPTVETSFYELAVPPWGRRGFKPRIRPPYPQRVVKGD